MPRAYQVLHKMLLRLPLPNISHIATLCKMIVFEQLSFEILNNHNKNDMDVILALCKYVIGDI